MNIEIGLADAVKAVLGEHDTPMSPAQIRDRVKVSYPHLYSTPAHLAGIARGNYQNEDHALLNPIYSLVMRSSDFVLDRTGRPMMVSLATAVPEEAEAPGENYESDMGIVYVLSTELFTRGGKHIVKIGHTTQTIERRISQLYTTGTPYQFKELKSWRVRNYVELEQALHLLLAPFRVNRGREFFTEDAVAFIEGVVSIHGKVLQAGSDFRSI